jgi:hypothetical protein
MIAFQLSVRIQKKEQGSPFFENKKNSRDDQDKADRVVPLEFFLQVKDGKNGKHNKGDDFLYGLQLCGGKLIRAYAVGRHLEAVFHKGDEPADDDDLPQGRLPVLKVPVPGDGHEDVGNSEKYDGFHFFALYEFQRNQLYVYGV